MDFDTYQKKSRKTAIYPNKGDNVVYPTLGIAGEAGEVSEKIKKILREEEGRVSKKKKGEIAKELGLSLNEIAQQNIKKLSSRKKRDKLKGSGDNR